MNNKHPYWLLFGFFMLPVFLFLILMYGTHFNYAQDVDSLLQKKQQLESKIDSLHSVMADMEGDMDAMSKVHISKIVATAYNSYPWQTDDTPFITSSGSEVADGTLALSRDMIRAENALMHRMGFNPSGMYAYGDTVFVIYVKPMVVHDTMNRRFSQRADIWLDDLTTARKWGKRKVYIASRSDS